MAIVHIQQRYRFIVLYHSGDSFIVLPLVESAPQKIEKLMGRMGGGVGVNSKGSRGSRGLAFK